MASEAEQIGEPTRRHPPPSTMTWERDGSDWPNREASRFVVAGGLEWHLQQMGQGPLLLLVHGTGAATHTWRDLAPLLAQRFTVLAPDLPGHGFTETLPPRRMSLPDMASGLDALLKRLAAEPVMAVGHSAGAAILVRMHLEGQIALRALVSLNGALLPFRGVSGVLFPPAAKLLAASGSFARYFAKRTGTTAAAERMVENTGSRIDRTGVEFYRRIMASERHVGATLAMLSSWDVRPLSRALYRFDPPLVLVTGARDRSVDPRNAPRVQALAPNARVVELPDLGHLAHEEAPGRIADLIREVADSVRLRAQ